jgi:hypothetical protein
MVLFMKGLETRTPKNTTNASGRNLLGIETDAEGQPLSPLDRWPSFAEGAAAPDNLDDLVHERRLTQIISILNNFPRVSPKQIKDNACAGCKKTVEIFR